MKSGFAQLFILPPHQYEPETTSIPPLPTTFTGHVIPTGSQSPYSLIASKSLNPPEIHPCCFDASSLTPIFYDIKLTSLKDELDVLSFSNGNFTSFKQIKLISLMRIVQYIPESGDYIHLTTNYNSWVVVNPENVGTANFEFIANKIKTDRAAYEHIERYFVDVKPSEDALIVLGKVEMGFKEG